jgi:hypothetical protein
MSDTFPLLLKEGWPEHSLIMIQMQIPAGVVDMIFTMGSSVRIF